MQTEGFPMLTQADKDRISAAITEAESKSRGEIFCVLAHEVSRYREVPLFWATVAALSAAAAAGAGGAAPAGAGLHLLQLDR